MIQNFFSFSTSKVNLELYFRSSDVVIRGFSNDNSSSCDKIQRRYFWRGKLWCQVCNRLRGVQDRLQRVRHASRRIQQEAWSVRDGLFCPGMLWMDLSLPRICFDVVFFPQKAKKKTKYAKSELRLIDTLVGNYELILNELFCFNIEKMCCFFVNRKLFARSFLNIASTKSAPTAPDSKEEWARHSGWRGTFG